MSRELSLHPVHLTPDKEGNLPPSALVPFCSYQGDSYLLGQKRPELNDTTVCNKFNPIILEGQLCYSLDVKKYKKGPNKTGKENGLFLLLDPNPYHVDSNEGNKEVEGNAFKVYIHTLSQHTAYGPGAYGMNALKKMTSSKNFLQLPDEQKKCDIHNREECQTKKFIDQVESNCSCLPWLLAADHINEKVFPL